MKFVHIQNKISLSCKHKYFVQLKRHAMKFVHGHKLEFHATMDMNRLDHSCMLNGLPTFFMPKNSNEMNLNFTSINFTMEQT